MLDEFEIKAKANDGTERIWTRSKLEVAKSIAESSISKLGFTVAIVVNIHGGHRSNPLYVVLDVDIKDDVPDVEESSVLRLPRFSYARLLNR